ncbi:SRPBCC family protein [Ornithinimicrobium cerasi]|uniref:Polyketide cyclase / dehydrase and lipid transport n=1 Tax=Ornithinimicrobium cerasi TaxID=2248773 RepID=A0A285VUH3_9MICO|nr:SRPBCC family protein [Ornithinimicrobium cerasi]SOC57730.1 Polyketide cyclase / dehydrase and lipid transport [Ornithinimicrobium cerasi]
MRSRHLSRVIAAPPEKVYAFVADPGHLPAWASGLASGTVTQDGEALVVESPMGRVSVVFAPRNDHGVLDHDVTLPSGRTVTNHLRVLAHPDGSEIVFTLRQLDLTDEEFERDAQAVEADLDQLKGLLESTF